MNLLFTAHEKINCFGPLRYLIISGPWSVDNENDWDILRAKGWNWQRKDKSGANVQQMGNTVSSLIK